jgi:NADH:ubiquinone oxidoreductase subunit E
MASGPVHSSRYTPASPTNGNADRLSRIGELLSDLEADNAQLLPALHRIQHEYGYVPREAIPFLAGRFETTPALVYGTIEFYSEVRTTPPAETTVQWCSGPACLLKGSMNIRRALEAVLGCEMNGKTEDGKFGLQLVQCDGTCHLAPELRQDGKYAGPLTVSDAIEWARELKGEAPPEPKAKTKKDTTEG